MTSRMAVTLWLPSSGMHDPTRPAPWTKVQREAADVVDYHALARELRALLTGETDAIANAANAAAAVHYALPAVNWTGFYFLRGDQLVLGPFQGRPACVRIPLGRGVCGSAAAKRHSILVPDITAFPGHITCDPASRSELVVPLFRDGTVIGVLDLDSPEPARFDDSDRVGCEMLARVIESFL